MSQKLRISNYKEDAALFAAILALAGVAYVALARGRARRTAGPAGRGNERAI